MPIIIVIVSLLVTSICFAENMPRVHVKLDQENPSNSYAVFEPNSEKPHKFAVGTGRNGILPAGSRFQDGYSLLGDFRVSGILSSDQFEMAPDIINMSREKAPYLKEYLFSNMSAIDFDGDGKSSEYGIGYIGLTPLDSTSQPFTFGEFKGKYRWYNYAIHGTNDESRVGKTSTGGCINIHQDNLELLLKEIKIGDLVRIELTK